MTSLHRFVSQGHGIDCCADQETLIPSLNRHVRCDPTQVTHGANIPTDIGPFFFFFPPNHPLAAGDSTLHFLAALSLVFLHDSAVFRPALCGFGQHQSTRNKARRAQQHKRSNGAGRRQRAILPSEGLPNKRNARQADTNVGPK
jgi:hypothetical protein